MRAVREIASVLNTLLKSIAYDMSGLLSAALRQLRLFPRGVVRSFVAHSVSSVIFSGVSLARCVAHSVSSVNLRLRTLARFWRTQPAPVIPAQCR